jgi:hypothetical protein
MKSSDNFNKRLFDWIKSFSRAARTLDLSVTLLVLTMSGTLAFSAAMIGRLAVSQLLRPVLHDDGWIFTDRNNANISSWLFSQLNEHRILFSRLATIIETNYLGLPVASTALIQSALLLLLASGLLLLICRATLSSKRNQLLTWQAGTLILVNPWQWQSFVWEIQTSWFLTNCLVLATTLLLLHASKNITQRSTFSSLFLTAVIPWIAIFNHGSGFALAAAACLISPIVSFNFSLTTILSGLFAAITYFKILNYKDPYPDNKLYFDPDFFSRLLLGGPWQGLAFIVISLGIIVAFGMTIKSNAFNEQLKSSRLFPILMLPGVFTVIFSAMTTLGRSAVGGGYHRLAGFYYYNLPYYVTHTLLLGVSMVMCATVFSENSHISSSKSFLNPEPWRLVLYPSIVVILATAFSFPQLITRQSTLFRETWSLTSRERSAIENRFRCYAAQGKNPAKKCPVVFHNPLYFQGKSGIKPIGWHKKLLNLAPD